MNVSKHPIIAEDGLRFFGEMTASVSHEIKNCLAIMNESAGLIQDLVMLNQKGKPLDPERLDRIAGQITGQIQRADTVVKNLNSFAHSADVPEKSIDLGEILSLSMALAQRFAVNRGISLNLLLPKEKIIAFTRPFLLMHVIWQYLDFSMAAAGPEKMVTIIPQLKGENIEIVFQKLENLGNHDYELLFREKIEIMLEKLDGQLQFSEAQAEIYLVFNRAQHK
jgi:signal transduction histidine kinase